MSDQFFTVSELNTFIRDVITSGFPSAVWVCGEIQGMRVDQKGHTYFELCEQEDNAGGVKAKIKASIWSSRRVYIDGVLKRLENGFSLKDDIQVKFLCKVDFWQKGGTLSLSVENVDPTYTLGKIAQERQKLIALLQKDGILERNKKHELPAVMLHVGLVTSHDSAAYNDFLDELRESGFGFKIVLANAIMQGKTAEKSVVKALSFLSKVKDLDVVVITRGGGSIAELSCFDSEVISRAIADYRCPVITGIGHEINTTVTDLAAHTYAKTPTAVAQLLVVRIRDFLTGLDDRQRTIFNLVLQQMSMHKNDLRNRAVTLQSSTMQFLREHREHMLVIADSIKRLPGVLLKNQQKDIKEKQLRFLKIIHLNIANATIKMNHYQKMIDLASPANTLRRGFTISRNREGQVIRSQQQISEHDFMVTQFLDGSVESQVIQKLKE
jgi:exodeoxyribonuclease VII large subunit